jgi:uncharacterized protein (DUF2062 family)
LSDTGVRPEQQLTGLKATSPVRLDGSETDSISERMPKNLLKSMAPSPQKLRGIRSLRPLGNWIYEPNLWHINRLSAARAFAIGLFSAMMPIPGQMLISAYVAVRWGANLPISVSLIFITNPLTMPVIYYAAYKLGALMLGLQPKAVQFEISWEWLTGQLLTIWQPFLLGCFTIGFAAAAIGYFLIDVLWRMRVRRQWRARRLSREKKRA